MEAPNLWCAAVLVASLTAACGPADSAPPEETPVTAAVAGASTPLTWSLQPRSGLRPGISANFEDEVVVRSGQAEVRAGHVELLGGDAVELRWNGPFETRRVAFLDVRVEDEESWECVLTAELVLRGSRLPLKREWVELLVGGPAHVRFALPALPPGQSEVTAIEVRVEGVFSPGTRVFELSLEWRAPEPWSSAEEASGVVVFDGEARPSLLLRSGDGARADVRLAQAGSSLAFAYGRSQRTPGQPGELSLSLAVNGSPVQTLPLDAPELWHTAHLPLPGAAGDLVELSLALEAAPGEVFLALAEAAVLPPDDPRPNVLLVTSDTHRGDHLGAASTSAGAHTPVLDALAARGVLFEDCFATSHVTLPSHTAMFTGTHPRDTGILDNVTVLSEDAPTLAEAFRDAGYLTCAATSMSLLADGHSGLGQGFLRRDAPDRTRTADETVAVALDWLADPDPRPLFLWVHLADAHAPYEPPPEFLRDYWPASRDAFDPDAEAAEHAPRWLEQVRDLEYVRALYRGEVSYLDAQLRPLLEHPRLAEGVLAVTADHGESLGAHGFFWRHKGLHPDTLHVPLILAWPGAPAGQRVSAPVGHLDLGRTLLDLAGLEARFPGRSLAGEAPGSGDRHAIATGRRSASITRGRMHLIQHLVEPHRVELYDLAADPATQHNLVAPGAGEAHLPLARELRVALLAWLAEASEGGRGRWAGARHTDEQTLEELAALGYADQLEDDGAGSLGLPPECPCEGCQRFR